MRHLAVLTLAMALCTASAGFWSGEKLDLVMGNWEGECDPGFGIKTKLTGQIIALGGDKYNSILTISMGQLSKTFRFPMDVKSEGGKLVSSAKVSLGKEFGGDHEWNAT